MYVERKLSPDISKEREIVRADIIYNTVTAVNLDMSKVQMEELMNE